jgi:hypothetical protein
MHIIDISGLWKFVHQLLVRVVISASKLSWPLGVQPMLSSLVNLLRVSFGLYDCFSGLL